MQKDLVHHIHSSRDFQVSTRLIKSTTLRSCIKSEKWKGVNIMRKNVVPPKLLTSLKSQHIDTGIQLAWLIWTMWC